MIACDSSTLIAMLAGDPGEDVRLAKEKLASAELAIPPAVLTEILSNAETAALIARPLADLHVLDVAPGYWRRAGATRAILIGKKLKARFADALIAQSCIDANTMLITRDRDFRHFAAHCGLKLGAPL